MKRCCLSGLVAFCLGFATGLPADLLNANGFSESVLTGAFEKGCSLVIAEILSVREDKPTKFYFYKAKIIRPVVLGDLTEDDIQNPLELFAGTSFGDALKLGSTYALFITKDCSYHFSWAHRNDVVKVDIADQQSLDALVQAAKSAYEKTSICKFRERKLTGRISLPSLPDEIIAASERFRYDRTARAEFGKKLYESDMGSRRDQSQPESPQIKYLPPVITLSRKHILYLLGPPTIRCGRTYHWFCGQDRDVEEPKKHVGILSATFDENEKFARLLYQVQEQAKWTGYAKAGVGRRELPEPAKSVMLQFQQALKDSDWEKALSLCSEKVKRKAKQSDSAEVFFKSVVPIQEVISFSDFRVRGWSSGGWGIERYHYDVGVRVPERDFAGEWEWSVVRTPSGWFIDFKPYSLEVWMKHQILMYTRKPGKPRATWEEVRKGLEIRLLPVSKEVVIGKPMLFHIEMTSVSDDTLEYWCTSWVANDPMVVKGPNGVNVPYMGGPAQVAFWHEYIEPGETIVLVDNYDVTSQYHITKPGKYSFQFKKLYNGSNIVEVDIKPGPLSPLESVVEVLTPILPQGWELARWIYSRDFLKGEQLGRRLGIHLAGERQGKGWRSSISIIILLDVDEVKVEHQGYLGDFWGNCRWGPVYVNAYGAELLWPDYREQIVEVLGIREVQPD
jgi:hypothetical protein